MKRHTSRFPQFGIFFIATLFPLALIAGKRDTTFRAPDPIHKNVIKWNITPMLLWSSKNITLSYERILGPKQSVTLTVGFLEFPSLFKDTIGGMVNINSREKFGINLGFEYRFYLMQRNRRPIPDGLYLAPYASYYGYSFKNGIDILQTTVDTAGLISGKFYIFNLGLELGYQFVFWKRFTLDLVVFGPSISYYGGSLAFSGGLNLEQIKDLDSEIYQKIKEKYPYIDTFFDNKTFLEKSNLDLFSLGFRYVIQLGFHF